MITLACQHALHRQTDAQAERQGSVLEAERFVDKEQAMAFLSRSVQTEEPTQTRNTQISGVLQFSIPHLSQAWRPEGVFHLQLGHSEELRRKRNNLGELDERHFNGKLTGAFPLTEKMHLSNTP